MDQPCYRARNDQYERQADILRDQRLRPASAVEVHFAQRNDLHGQMPNPSAHRVEKTFDYEFDDRHRAIKPNEKGQRPEPAAADVRFVCGPTGWLRFAAPGWFGAVSPLRSSPAIRLSQA